MVTRALLATSLVAGCMAREPEVPDLGDGRDAGIAPFADVVLGWTEGGEAMSCGAELAGCGVAATCGPTEVLGAPDGTTYALEPGSLIQVALLCSHIIERGPGDAADFKVWATFPEGASAVVEVSFDGTVWYTLVTAAASDPVIDIDPSGFDVVRYIRISNRGTAAIALDAIEALR